MPCCDVELPPSSKVVTDRPVSCCAQGTSHPIHVRHHQRQQREPPGLSQRLERASPRIVTRPRRCRQSIRMEGFADLLGASWIPQNLTRRRKRRTRSCAAQRHRREIPAPSTKRAPHARGPVRRGRSRESPGQHRDGPKTWPFSKRTETRRRGQRQRRTLRHRILLRPRPHRGPRPTTPGRRPPSRTRQPRPFTQRRHM